MAESETTHGSIFEDTEMIMEMRLTREEEEHSDEGLESLAGCSCRSQCTRRMKQSRSGRTTGCPCKGSSLLCGVSCNCGSARKPCKNKAGQSTGSATLVRETHPDRSRAADGAGSSTATQPSVEEMIDGLDLETLSKICKKGFQSRPLELRDLIAEEGSNEAIGSGSQTNRPPNFCICGRCCEMPTDKEMVCCRERRNCLSQTSAFHNICIESQNLQTSIRSLADTYVFTPVYSNKGMRHAAYRQFIMWRHGHLGRGYRKVIPSCCVNEIRKNYPSPDGQYTGYKD